MEVNTYIGFGALMLMCAQHGFCGLGGLKNATILQMVSHKHYNLNANGDFILFYYYFQVNDMFY